MSLRPRNRNQYLYVTSTGPGCWGTCSTATQGGEWLSSKIHGAALWTSSARTAWRHRPRWIVCPSETFLGDEKWCDRRERGVDCMEVGREPPTWISARVPWLCWPYRPCIVVEQNDPTGELAWLFRFDCLANGGQDLRIMLCIHCCPTLQEIYEKGAILVKEESQHNLSCTCVDSLGFFWWWWPWMLPLVTLSFRFWFEVMIPSITA